MSDDYFLKLLPKRKNGLRGLSEFKKINILFLITLVICAGLFFSVLLAGGDAYAEKPSGPPHPKPETIDPLERIGQSSFSGPAEKLCQANPVILLSATKTAKQDVEEEEAVANLRNLVAGYPIERMVPYIAKQNKLIAAFLISIARKESTWGEHAPHLDGRDCYNYWGYEGSYNPVGGYSCFDSPKQAVSVVSRRLQTLIDQKLTTPARMIVWKCGGNCAADSGASDWIAAVSQYFYKLNS